MVIEFTKYRFINEHFADTLMSLWSARIESKMINKAYSYYLSNMSEQKSQKRLRAETKLRKKGYHPEFSNLGTNELVRRAKSKSRWTKGIQRRTKIIERRSKGNQRIGTGEQSKVVRRSSDETALRASQIETVKDELKELQERVGDIRVMKRRIMYLEEVIERNFRIITVMNFS